MLMIIIIISVPIRIATTRGRGSRCLLWPASLPRAPTVSAQSPGQVLMRDGSACSILFCWFLSVSTLKCKSAIFCKLSVLCFETFNVETDIYYFLFKHITCKRRYSSEQADSPENQSLEDLGRGNLGGVIGPGCGLTLLTLLSATGILIYSRAFDKGFLYHQLPTASASRHATWNHGSRRWNFRPWGSILNGGDIQHWGV